METSTVNRRLEGKSGALFKIVLTHLVRTRVTIREYAIYIPAYHADSEVY